VKTSSIYIAAIVFTCFVTSSAAVFANEIESHKDLIIKIMDSSKLDNNSDIFLMLLGDAGRCSDLCRRYVD
jgi:hypothetical protein